jgi:hypothetical protein
MADVPHVPQIKTTDRTPGAVAEAWDVLAIAFYSTGFHNLCEKKSLDIPVSSQCVCHHVPKVRIWQ